MPELKFDHAVFVVPNLEQGVRQFHDLGFTVVKGGSHGITHNALIMFSDDSYIELLAFKSIIFVGFFKLLSLTGILNLIIRQRKDIHWRLLQWMKGIYGCVDWAVRTDNLTANTNRMKKLAEITSPRKFSRIKSDGSKIMWTLGGVKDMDVPFLIEDITPSKDRLVTSGQNHHNGSLFVRKVAITPKNTHLALQRISTLFGYRVDGNESVPDLKIGETKLCISKALSPTSRVSLEIAYSGSEKKLLELDKTFGTCIWLVPK